MWEKPQYQPISFGENKKYMPRREGCQEENLKKTDGKRKDESKEDRLKYMQEVKIIARELHYE
jgi:hypothetical protein